MRIALAVCLLAPAAFASEPIVLEAIEGEGEVKVRHADGSAVVADEGLAVVEGDVVSTGAGVAARLLYPDGSQLALAEESELEIQKPEAGAPTAALKKGSVSAKVTKAAAPASPHKLFIKTSAAVMGVRGTQFVVDQDAAGKTELHTLEGRVEVAKSREELGLGKGDGVEAEQTLSADSAGIGKVVRFERAAFLKVRQLRHPHAHRLGQRALRSLVELGRARKERLERRQLKEKVRNNDKRRHRE